jgi:hypothetical protein
MNLGTLLRGSCSDELCGVLRGSCSDELCGDLPWNLAGENEHFTSTDSFLYRQV